MLLTMFIVGLGVLVALIIVTALCITFLSPTVMGAASLSL